ncbi:hypothetical protein [Streptomyces sp. YGL11-2]|uniref:hypothetical protein n=1 Tax=Streptomyces sp. YGL11-2 TaxID=3414028 RepID=UPI003CFA66E4
MATFGGVLLSTAGLVVTGYFAGGDAPPWLVAVFLALWCVSAWGNNPPMNSRILRMDGDAGTEAVALNSRGQYVGVSLAGAFGGAALAFSGGTTVLLAGAVIGLVTIAIMTFAVLHYPATAAASLDASEMVTTS